MPTWRTSTAKRGVNKTRRDEKALKLPPPVPVTEGLVRCPQCGGGVRPIKSVFAHVEIGIHVGTLLYGAHRIGGARVANFVDATKCQASGTRIPTEDLSQMSDWNYRLTVRTCDDAELWEVREIYYDDEGNVKAWSKDAVAPGGESWQECSKDISRMLYVISLPAYDLDASRWCDRERKEHDAHTPLPARPYTRVTQ